MNDGNFILVSKTEESLYIQLTTVKVRNKFRYQWEMVEGLDNATKFRTAVEIDKRTVKHKCPLMAYKVRHL